MTSWKQKMSSCKQDTLLDLTDEVRDQLSKVDELLFEANLAEAQKLLRSVANSIDVALEQ